MQEALIKDSYFMGIERSVCRRFGVLTVTLAFFSLIFGCATSSHSLLKDRYTKLAPLGEFRARTCKIETTLSEPMKIKYLQLYPTEHALLQENTWTYTWTALESRCEITTPDKSNLRKSHRAILNAAFCTLLQAHWVNSPFDEMRVENQQIEEQKDKVFIRQAKAEADMPDLGVAVYMKDFLLETNTKKLGLLRAHYAHEGSDWLPDWLEQRFHTSVVRVDQIVYRDEGVGRRKMLDSFWISVGESEPQAHTFVKILDCN
jgi:hypothetical protein